MLFLLALSPAASHADDPWIKSGADGKPQVQLYFFWSLTCPHCTEAHPYIAAIPQERPWVKLHELELTLVLAGLDAFNPCAFFVLLFLLSMLAHQTKVASACCSSAACSCWFRGSCISPSWPPGSMCSNCSATWPG
jgi:hypothetical protein